MLAAWRDSPTRLREDAATEADLVRAGYRDRLLTELAQNAADAAARAGVPGAVWVRIDGAELHIANTGAPLDLSGVHALTALRASGKTGTAVGRFGVGFTAVRSVSDEIEVRSRHGGLHFSLDRTRAALRESGITATITAPPVLRLAWPAATPPAPDADTEVVLRLRPGVDAAALLSAMRAEAVDLLLELPDLREIHIGAEKFTVRSAPVALPGDRDGAGGIEDVRIAGPEGESRWWQFRTRRARWLLPVRDGRPVPATPDVLRAPTRSDEELSLPALLIADIPMQPDRRRLLPGARVRELAEGYADFARALPELDRLVLVPAPGFARSEADSLIREALLHELRTRAWLPVLGAPETARSRRAEDILPSGGFAPDLADRGITGPEPGPDGSPRSGPPGVAVPTRASVLPGLTADLASVLGELTGPLVPPELSTPRYLEQLAVLDVHRLGLARLAELSAGLERSPSWWREFYAALEPFVVDPLAAEELGALAVPLADGRLVTGPRTVLLDDQLAEVVPLHWARLVHPEAAHPLLSRLGARSATAADLLTDPALRAELEDCPDDEDTVDAVLRLAPHVAPEARPGWLGMLELPDDSGGTLPADELLLPDAPLRDLLVADAPFGTVAPAMVEAYGAEALRAVGVGWDFTLVTETDPTGPDHHLDDEETWWASLDEDPPTLVAVRDLDLIDDRAWPRALRLLAADPRTRPLLADPRGYTPWWLRRHAHLDGIPLGHHRHPADPEFTGLLPDFPAAGFDPAELAALRPVLADPEALDLDLAEALLAALADPDRSPEPGVVAAAHRRLAAAVQAGRLEVSDLEPPERVRALSGAAVDPADAMVLDVPWFGLAVAPNRLVAGAADTADSLAALLDLPLVSEAVTAEVLGEGRRTTWAAEPLAVVLRETLTAPADGDLVLHEELRVRLDGAVRGTVEVPWWRTGTTTHVRAPELLG
ncbi:sacsin N-terminal ATP-binding-like domain-containing protein [Nocardia farcinica]|uniref:sacsin N-terminal ATP-binding-like domain-containing protein n=1 Tax=Nocardia farcinica TaxID=37329 RepID=UPI0037BB6B9A